MKQLLKMFLNSIKAQTFSVCSKSAAGVHLLSGWKLESSPGDCLTWLSFRFWTVLTFPHVFVSRCPSPAPRHISALQSCISMTCLLPQCATTAAQATCTLTGRWLVSFQRTRCECLQQSWDVHLVRISHKPLMLFIFYPCLQEFGQKLLEIL